MKRIIWIVLFSMWLMTGLARGLRHSVCLVAPEYSTELRSEVNDLALQLSRNGKTDAAHLLQTSMQNTFYGSGVVINHKGTCVLTSAEVIGLAQRATICVLLHDKTLRFRGCEVLGTDTLSGLSLIAIPESDDIDPIPWEKEPIKDGDNIVVAGYSTLSNQPTWQIEHGWVSNAWMQQSGKTYIQHTAPINPGMTGAPLLIKGQDGYRLTGINVHTIAGRDEVAVAVPMTHVQHILNSDNLVSSEQLQEILQMQINQPNPTEWYNILSPFKVHLYYHNYMSNVNMETGIGYEIAFGKKSMGFWGLQWGAAFTEGYVSAIPGTYLGFQVPVHMGEKHSLVPRISQGVNVGFGGCTLITSDSRLGMEYQYHTKIYSYIVALEYTTHVLFSDEYLATPTQIGRGRHFIPYLNHAIGIRLGIGIAKPLKGRNKK